MRRCLNPKRSEPREKRPDFFDKHLRMNLNKIFHGAPGASQSRSRKSRPGSSLNDSNARQLLQPQHRGPAQLPSDRNASGGMPFDDIRIDDNPPEVFLSDGNYPLLVQQLQNVQQQQWESFLASIPSGPHQPQAPTETHIQPVAPLVSPLLAPQVSPLAPLLTARDSHGQYHNPMNSMKAQDRLEETRASTLAEVNGHVNYLPRSEAPPSVPVAMPLPPTSETPLFQIRGPQVPVSLWGPVATRIDVRLKHSYITQSLAVMLGAELIPFHPGHSFQEIPCTDYVEGVSFAYDFYGRSELHDLTIRVWPDSTQPAMLYIGCALMARLFDKFRLTTLDSPGN